MQTVVELQELKNARVRLRDGGGRLALVPTMGALHEGHLELVREARRRADHVAVSIFVNPAQFGPNEDLDAYPRRMAADAALLAAENVDLLWAPTAKVMYPPGFATTVQVAGISEGLCGASRPGHFEGVATVVAKLLNQVEPDIALFGEKDYQQLAVIRALVRDLDLGVEIVGVLTVRDADGLALSSRNAYLSAAERRDAAALPRSMQKAVATLEAGAPAAAALAEVERRLREAGFHAIDYVRLCDAATLEELTAADRPARLLVAARIGGTRLIDNMPVTPAR